MNRITRAAAFAVLLLGALVLPVSAQAQRPMYGQFSGSGIPADQRCGPAALTLGFAISGTATHLGRFAGTGTNCTEFTLATAAVAIWDGLVTLEAADGSTLTTSYEGGQGAPATGVASFAHTHVVTGGTGRFEGAVGRLTVAGEIDLVAFTLSGTVTGWLSY
jgi:hypothetical protein